MERRRTTVATRQKRKRSLWHIGRKELLGCIEGLNDGDISNELEKHVKLINLMYIYNNA